jgi:transcriptional regulator with XRE-family HTH domain
MGEWETKNGSILRMPKNPDPIALRLGKRIKTLRKRKGLTQEDLADRSKLSVIHIQVLEGKNPPSPTLRTLQKLAKGLDVEMWELLKFDE